MLINKLKSGLLLFITATFIVSCSSISVTTDYDKTVDFTKYKTFSFYHLKTSGQVSQLNADRIANAIKKEMLSKGYVEDNANPDLLVNSVLVIEDKVGVTSSTNYYGYGGYYRPYGWGPTVATTSVSTYEYKDGTMIIDVIDAKTEKLVWEGVGTKELNSNQKDPEEAINFAVYKIMANFPTLLPKK
jgi:hypothetical protein